MIYPKVLGRRILMRPNDKTTKTESGIYLVDGSSKGNATEGVVLSIGPKVVEVKVGDSIKISQYSETILNFDGGETLYTVDENDVLGVFNE